MSPATVVRNRHVVGPDEVERWLRPRHVVVRELPGTSDDDGTTTAFALDTGPVHSWERTVTATPADGAGGAAGAVEVVEEVRYRLAVPVWGVLFRFALSVTFAARPPTTTPGRRGGRRPSSSTPAPPPCSRCCA